jgi:cobalt-zinc-cadmium efflux system membrane fusion protein
MVYYSKYRLLAVIFFTTQLVACNKHEGTIKEPVVQVQGETIAFAKDNPQTKVLMTAKAQTPETEELALPGRLSLSESKTARVYTAFAGRIESVLVDWGQTVKAGQALAKISSPDIGQSQSELAKSQADLRLAQQNFERAKSLFEEGVTAERDFQMAQADLTRAKAETDRTLAKANAYHTGQQVNQNGVMFSPIAGRIIERNATAGTEVRPDNNAPGVPPLFVISDPSVLTAVIDLPETELSRVTVGQELEISATAAPDKKFKATVLVIQDQIDPVSRSVKLRALVDNKDLALKAEQFVSAKLTVPAGAGVVVPNAAVLLLDRQTVVFVDVGNGKYERRKVTSQPAGFDRTRVITGLNNGEAVVTEGALFLQQVLVQGRKS